MASGLRSKDYVELVGYVSESLNTDSRLPTLGQALCKLFYHIRKEKKSVRDAAR